MLVVSIVIEVTTVLLDTWVDAQLACVDLLGPQMVILEMAIDRLDILAVLHDSHGLDILALDDVVPVAIWATGRWLWLREEAGLAHLLWEHHGDFIPDGLGLRAHLVESIGERTKDVAPRRLVAGCVRRLELERILENELLWCHSSCRCADEGGGSEQLHDYY